MSTNKQGCRNVNKRTTSHEMTATKTSTDSEHE